MLPGSQRGLGTLILSMNAQMDTAGTFSVFIILALLGIVLNLSLRVIERRLQALPGVQFVLGNAAGMGARVVELPSP